MKSAILYARYSSAAQGGGFSIPRQVEYGTRYAEAQGWTVTGIITDEGRSAFHGSNRRQGSTLHDFEIEAREGLHKGTTLVVENLDRLSRQGAKATAQLVWGLNEAGVDVATWHDGIIYSKESTDLLELISVIIKAQMAHEESLKKSQRTKASWARRYQRLASGDTTLIGHQPAWVERNGDSYEVSPANELLINRIFDLYISGVGPFKIATTLNQEGVPCWSAKAKGWYEGYIYRVLGNRAVLGDYVTLKGEVLATNYFPQVVSRAKWAAAREIRERRKAKPTGGRNWSSWHNLLQGLVVCGECGGNAAFEDKGANSVTRYKAADGTIREYPRKHYQRLRCSNNRRKKGCENTSLFDYKVVERVLLDQLLSMTLEDRSTSDQLLELKNQLASLIESREDIADRISRLLDQLERGSSTSITERLQSLEAQARDIQVAIDAQETRIEALATQAPLASEQALVDALRASLDSPDPHTRLTARASTNRALHRLVERIELYQEEWGIYTDFALWVMDKEGNIVGGQAL